MHGACDWQGKISWKKIQKLHLFYKFYFGIDNEYVYAVCTENSRTCKRNWEENLKMH